MSKQNTVAEGERARDWRLRHNLSQTELAELTGWTRNSIYLMERGINSLDKPISPWVWRRFYMACAGVEAKLRGQEFNW